MAVIGDIIGIVCVVVVIGSLIISNVIDFINMLRNPEEQEKENWKHR